MSSKKDLTHFNSVEITLL